MDNSMFSLGMIILYFGGALLFLIKEYFTVHRSHRDDINTVPRGGLRDGIAQPPRDDRGQNMATAQNTGQRTAA